MRSLLLALFVVASSFAGVKKTVCASGCDYATMQAAEDFFTKSYTGVGIDTIAPSAGSYNGTCLVSGQTNIDANNHILILGPAMTGIFGDPSHAILTNSTAQYTLYMLTGYHEIKNIEITNTSASAANIALPVLFLNAVSLNVNNVIAKSNSNQTVISAGNTVVVRNVVAYNSSSYSEPVFRHSNGTASYIQNFIFYGNGIGFLNFNGTSTIQNGYSYTGNVDSLSYKVNAGTCNISYIASDDASASGTGSLTNVSVASASFANAPTNFLINTSSSLYNVGVNLSGSFTSDITGKTWDSWSMSANDPGTPAPPAADFLCNDGYCATISTTNHDSIMVYWKGDTASNGKIKEYAYGTNQGTLTSTTIINGRFGKTCSMTNSPASKVEFGAVNIIKTKWSMAAVFSMDGTVAWRSPFSIYESATNTFRLITNVGLWRFYLDNSYGEVELGTEFVANRYNGLVVVFDGTGATNADKLKVYINGRKRTLTFSGTVPTIKAATTATFNYANPGVYNFYGKMDDVAFWKGTLTDSQAVLITSNGSIRATFPAIETNKIYTWGRKTPYTTTVEPTVLSRSVNLEIRDSATSSVYATKVKTFSVGDSVYSDSIPFARGGWVKQHVTSSYGGLPLLNDSSSYTFGIGPIFLAVGQSNMVGQGALPYTTVNTGVKASMYKRGSWQILKDPIDTNKIVHTAPAYNDPIYAKGSLFPSFVNRLVPKLGNVPVGVIPAAVNGTALWQTVNPLFSWLFPVSPLSDTASNIFNPGAFWAKTVGPIDAILWYQGEHDALWLRTEQQHADSLTKVIRNYRDSLGLPNLPFLMVNLAKIDSPYVASNFVPIRAGIERVAQTVPNTKILCRPLDMGLPIASDGIHLTRESLDILGVCMADAYYDYLFPSGGRGGSPLRRMGLAP